MSKHRFTASASLAAALGCSGSGGNDVCSGIACSSRGFCITVASTPYCACITGYHPVGLTCVPNGTADPCEGIDCDGHGTCRAAADMPTCDCEPGYVHLADDPPICGEAGCDLHCVRAPMDAGSDDGLDDDAARDEGTASDDSVPTDAGGGCTTSDDCPDPGDCLVAVCNTDGRCGSGTAPDGASCSIGTCCSGGCVNTDSDTSHCGNCGNVCSSLAQADVYCSSGGCASTCWTDWRDLDGDGSCECRYASSDDPCNGADDNCNGSVDEDGCGIGLACDGGSCRPDVRFDQGPTCGDMGVDHSGADYLSWYTVWGPPGAQVHKWNRHASCGAIAGVAPETEPPNPAMLIGADGTVTFNLGAGAIYDCAHEMLGAWESWAVVDVGGTNYESNHVTTVFYNSTCPSVENCGLGGAFCP
jgi:hypothetical protein